MQQLNEEQINLIYNIIHDIKTSNSLVCQYLTGGTGGGKSFVTTALYQTALEYLNKRAGDDFTTRKILVLALTGKTAYHIKGTTIHSALKIPANQKLEHRPLNVSSCSTLRKEMAKVKLLFIDEISMVGFKMLNCIHQRLMEVFDNPNLFGGISVIFVGDLFQLKPVMDSYIFSQPTWGYIPLA